MSSADMVRAPSVTGLFKWRKFEPEVILLTVGLYLRFSLSYRWRSCSPSDYCNQLPSIPRLQHYKIKYGVTPRAETVAALNAAGAHRANVLT
jgi:hypothetical protein